MSDSQSATPGFPAGDPPSNEARIAWIGATPPAMQAWIVLAMLVVSVLPLLVVAHYPLVDYPNHLGRFQIYHMLDTSPALSKFWQWDWAIIPNLALDLLVVPLMSLMPVESAANLITLLALILLCVGTMLIDRQLHGRNWGLSLFAGIVLYNGAFRFGFVNYITTVAVALLAFAAWIRWRERSTGVGFLGFLATGAVLFVMHLYGFGLYSIAIGGYELAILWEVWRQDRRGILGALRIPAFGAASVLLPLALLLFSPTAGDAEVFRWSTPLWKLEALLSPIFFNMPYVELPLILVLGLGLAAGLITGVIRIHPRMFVSLAAMVVLFFVLQRTVLGSNYADYRLLSGVCFFFLASMRLDLPATPRRTAILAAIGLCFIVRIGSVLVNWVSVQPILAEYDHALAGVPPGARILVIEGAGESTSASRSPPLEHMPVFAAAKRQAFVPYAFHTVAVPLHIRPAYAEYAEVFSPYPEFARNMARYDYVLVLRHPQFTIPEGLALKPMQHGQSFALFAVERR